MATLAVQGDALFRRLGSTMHCIKPLVLGGGQYERPVSPRPGTCTEVLVISLQSGSQLLPVLPRCSSVCREDGTLDMIDGAPMSSQTPAR